MDQLLQQHQDRQEVARACGLLLKVVMEPLLEGWRRTYVKVPPELAAHLQAHAEFCVIMDFARVMRETSAETQDAAPVDSLLDRALEQLEQETERRREESDTLLE